MRLRPTMSTLVLSDSRATLPAAITEMTVMRSLTAEVSRSVKSISPPPAASIDFGFRRESRQSPR